jgi:hypothetical protein
VNGRTKDIGVAQDQFAAAVDDSYLLLAFLSRRSLTMNERDRGKFEHCAEAVTRVQDQVAARQVVSANDRAAFWEKFICLANLASPVTIETIRQYLKSHSHKRDPSRGPVWNSVASPRQRTGTGG